MDDVGLCDGVDEALLALHARGRASAGSVLVDGPSWPAGAARLRERAAAGLELGLHLNLTETLTPAVTGQRLPRLIVAAFARRLDGAALRAEIGRQCARFAELFGRAPDFVDGHQHVHQLPQVRAALLDELRARGWRPWIRGTRPPPAPPGDTSGDRLKALAIAALGAAGLAAAVRAAGLAASPHLLGVRAFDADPLNFASQLQGWLAAAGDGDVLMTHPARRRCAGDPLGAARLAEFEVLDGPTLGRLLLDQGVAIEPMSAIRGGGVEQSQRHNPRPRCPPAC